MSRVDAIDAVEKWFNAFHREAFTEEEYDRLYEAYCEKLEYIDEYCIDYSDYEDVPNLRLLL